MWEYRGQKRPPFAAQPQPGQESVWDYPRPPRVEACNYLIEVFDNNRLLARAKACCRVLETASPPTIYISDRDIDWSQLAATAGRSICEWKGEAKYWKLVTATQEMAVAWSYPEPYPEFDMLHEYTAFYPGRIACYLDGERVQPQPGKFYGGWVTANIVGPFKGEPGTAHW